MVANARLNSIEVTMPEGSHLITVRYVWDLLADKDVKYSWSAADLEPEVLSDPLTYFLENMPTADDLEFV